MARKSPVIAETKKQEKRIAEGLVPERRWGTPDDVGRIVAALLRGDAPYATGSVSGPITFSYSMIELGQPFSRRSGIAFAFFDFWWMK